MEQTESDTKYPRYASSTEVARAIAAVKKRCEAEQIILFGSGARGTMTETSDIDVLAITTPEPRAGNVKWHRIHEEDTDLDIVTMSRCEAEQHRRTAGRVQQSALEEGVVIHLATDEIQPLPIGTGIFTDENGMVRTSKLNPMESATYLENAERNWKDSNVEAVSERSRCRWRQQTMEHVLIALIIAHGERFPHTHDLNKLWNKAERIGEPLPTQRSKALLRDLTEYAQDLLYAKTDDELDRGALQTSAELCGKVIEHARARVPAIAKETRALVEKTPVLMKLLKPSRDLFGKSAYFGDVEHA